MASHADSRDPDVPADLGDVLPGALAAARAALRELDPDDIPTSLRRVAAASGRRLPPPLRRSLLRELDESEWLRNEAREKAGDLDPPSAAFLERPDGWWMVVADALASRRAQREFGQAAQDERRLDQVKDRLEDTKAKLRAARQERIAAEAEVKALRKSIGREKTEARNAIDPSRDAIARRVEELEAALGQREADHRNAEGLVADLTVRLRRMRKARAAAERLVAAGPSGRPTDPVAAARDLDLAAAAVPRRAVPAPKAERETSGRRRDAFRLPHGVGPDSAAAVRWLASRTEPFIVVVDGYNLLFHLDPGEFTTGTARRALADLMARFARASEAVLRVVVVFDSALTGERQSRPVDERVEMRFAPSDRSADEEIVALAGEIAGDVVVVSSDREVIDGADAAGALPLWSEAFVAWRG